jgi:hypothetical protein
VVVLTLCLALPRLHVIADPPRLLKNLWNCIHANKLAVDEDTIVRINLKSPIIDGSYVKSLLSLQTGYSLRLAYKLHISHVSPSQYEKMTVSLTGQFFTRSTASAIEVCVKNELLPAEAMTTACFF